MLPAALGFLAGLTLLSASAHGTGQAERRRYDGDSVVRVHATTVREVQAALALTDDLWSHGAGVGAFDMRVTQAQRKALDAAGLNYDVLIPDLQARIDAEAARLDAMAEGGIAAEDWFADFKNLAAINARLDELAAQHPGRASVFTVGTSFLGKPIRGLRITRNAPANAPAFLVDACQHAREWATPMTAMYLADRLLETADTDARLGALLDSAVIYVIPVVNVDGYDYSWTTERLWRKNRQPNADGSMGTDPNRNWGYGWGGEGAATNGSSDTYRGTAPFSAPEPAALRDFYTAHPEIAGSLDLHSYSQLVMWPWGWTSALCPDNALHAAVGGGMQYAIKQSGGLNYVAGPIYTTIYPASGGSVDWSYGDQGVTSFTIEVRDTGTYGFIMPPAEILPCARENMQGALALMEGVLGPAVILPNSIMPDVVPSAQATPVSVQVQATTGSVASVVLHTRVGSEGAFTSIPMSGVGTLYSASLPASPCGTELQWWFEAVGATRSAVLPAGAPATVFSALVQDTEVLFDDDMQNDLGWTVGATDDSATSGIWTRVDPVGTTAQPEDDHSPTGTRCWVTGQGVFGGSAGAADVDGGVTTLTSPWLNGSNLQAELVYWRWYSNNQGSAPNTDSMPVEWTQNGTTWTLLEDVSTNAGAWVEKRIGLQHFLPAPGQFRIRFRARDLGAGSVVEAGVDDVRVEVNGCPFAPADLNTDGTVDGTDLGLLLGAWGQPGLGDLNQDGTVDGTDLGLLLGSWS